MINPLNLLDPLVKPANQALRNLETVAAAVVALPMLLNDVLVEFRGLRQEIRDGFERLEARLDTVDETVGSVGDKLPTFPTSEAAKRAKEAKRNPSPRLSPAPPIAPAA